MEKFKIAKKVTVKRGNKVSAEALRLTRRTDSEDVRRVFQLLWEKAKTLTPAAKFDPLGIFEEEEEEDLYR